MNLNHGDRVLLKSVESLSELYDVANGFHTYERDLWIDPEMIDFLGTEVTIDYDERNGFFHIIEDSNAWTWDVELIAFVIPDAADEFEIPDYDEFVSALL